MLQLKEVAKNKFQYTEKRMKKFFFQVTLKYVKNKWILTIRLFKVINIEFNITDALNSKN